MAVELLALWSVPRSRSTAFSRMMVERGDFTVVHEPFSHATFFGEAEVAGRACGSPAEVKAALLRAAEDGPVFFKDTLDYRYPDVLEDAEFLRRTTHTFLIRAPSDVVASYLRLAPAASRKAMGFELLCELLDAAVTATGTPAFGLDGDDLVADPVGTVRNYCAAVGIAFEPSALTWPTGALPLWRRSARWHEDVGRTTGFVRTPGAGELDPSLRERAAELVAHHRPFYERLRAMLATGGNPPWDMPR